MEEMYKQLEAFTPQELQMLEDAQTLGKMQQKAKQNWHRAQHPPTDKSWYINSHYTTDIVQTPMPDPRSDHRNELHNTKTKQHQSPPPSGIASNCQFPSTNRFDPWCPSQQQTKTV